MNCFSFEKSVLSIDEIMAKTKLAKATIYRLLWTLERNDLVGYDQSLNRYRLGNKPLEYGLMPTNFVGRRRTLHNGALGIVLLSYMDEEFVYDFLKRYPLEQHTSKTVMDEIIFINRLKEIRELGYFVDVDETFMGYTALAAPIFNEKNEAIAALAISGASFKMEGSRREELTSLLKDVAFKISKHMGLR
ncbi:IclR family transcriptional regulator [Schinkia azotoformans]|uniref:IclR family transcriptional regulator n=1 Tax=Schinkia azotoformans TaxID=1454 RepID=UPI002DBB1806|nr:IclR family transcriptional regulator C-terminal domain-containing protein [Schinkia azotoformans]MEC1695514.1 IclR family transcriptional regulator C-terminal domain-containing protein [Schinkia azotoformans]MEC1727163.1 IclR family transcriptional regulator C-terminal domain-containing protein [Schinkia azotoformans]MEC1743582.1 IclR family transcriptional regulator C-terminal domain-containing protein [Schinkia azotoformans]MEC1748225.1 IclR family transcriptional regulator C-terminal dom